MYPIEKYSWHKISKKEAIEVCENNGNGCAVFGNNEIIFYQGYDWIVSISRNDGDVYINYSNLISFEELQAIYETAKQIKEENSSANLLENDLLFEEETDEKVNTELQMKKVKEEIKRCSEEVKKYEEKHKEDYEEYARVGYRELEKEEISKKSCWQCSHFKGGYIGAGCWCSQKKCDYEENNDVLTLQ